MQSSDVICRINGRRVRAPAGSTILEAARRAGIDIPTLCSGRDLAPAEACRLCVVEVRGNGRPVAACSTPVTGEMEISTDTPRLQAERRMVFDLLLKEHYGDCLAPCRLRCPTGMDVQGYIALIARGEYGEAVRLMRASNPFPSVCGRICPHPCEAVCRRNRVDEPVAIMALKRFATDYERQNHWRLMPPKQPATEIKLAVIGGGAQGLSAGFFLAKQGHSPVVFEAMPYLGGLLRTAIPASRLPRAVLEWDIKAILEYGVAVRLCQSMGRHFGLASLLADGFSAVMFATGGWDSLLMHAAPEESPGPIPNLHLLLNLNLAWSRKQETGLGRRVVIVGGGAKQCLDTALACRERGASQVTVLWNFPRDKAVVDRHAFEAAEARGVEFHFGVRVAGLRGRGDHVSAIDFDSGDQHPQNAMEMTLALDSLVLAGGRLPELMIIPSAGGQERKQKGPVRWETVNPYPSKGPPFASVYAVRSPVSDYRSAVEAIGAGRRAAEALDRHLRGLDMAAPKEFMISKGALNQADEVNFQAQKIVPREVMPLSNEAQRLDTNLELELGFSQEQAVQEAQRCLACGCQAFYDCRLRGLAHELDQGRLVMQPTAPDNWQIRDGHPHIIIEDAKCIVCRICERACRDYHGRNAIRVDLERVSELSRFRRHRIEISPNCDNCGLCASLCPTGALTFKEAWCKPGPLPATRAESMCDLCPIGCRTLVGRFGEHLIGVQGAPIPPAWGHLCQRGRFEMSAGRDAPGRLTSPLVQRGGELVKASWDEALDAVVNGIAAIEKAHGGESLAGLALGRGTLEEFYLFGKLVRLGLFSNSLDFMSPQEEEPATGRLLGDLMAGVSRFRYGDIENQDLLVVVGSGLSAQLPLLEPAIHRMVQNGGKLILMCNDPALEPWADMHQDLEPFDAFELVAMIFSRGGGSAEARNLLTGAARSLVLVAESCITETNHERFRSLLQELRQESIRVTLVPMLPAVWALRRAGISPVHYPGHRPVSPRSQRFMEQATNCGLPSGAGRFAAEILRGVQNGEVRGLVLFAGHNPVREQVSRNLLDACDAADFLVLLATHSGPLAERAHVVLPCLLSFENQGTMVSGGGDRYEAIPALSPPPGLRPTWSVLAEATGRFGGRVTHRDLVGVQSEMIVIDQVFASHLS